MPCLTGSGGPGLLRFARSDGHFYICNRARRYSIAGVWWHKLALSLTASFEAGGREAHGKSQGTGQPLGPLV